MVTHVSAEAQGDERGALLAFIEEQRGGIRRSLLGLTEEQAASRPTASELSLSGLLKHAAEVEQGWIARARQDLRERIGLLLEDEMLRFGAILDEAGEVDAVAAVRLYQAEYSLEAAR